MEKRKTTIPAFILVVAIAACYASKPEHDFWFKATNTGNDCFENGQLDNADVQLTAALHEVQAREPESGKLITALINEAFLKTVEKQSSQAEDLFAQAGKAIEVEGNDSSRRSEQPTHLTNLADAYSLTDRYDLARPIYTRALELAAKINGADSAQVATTACRWADMNCRQKNYSEAEGLYKKALAIRKKLTDANAAENTIIAMEGLATCLGKQEKYDEAIKTLQDAMTINSKNAVVNLVRLAGDYRSQAKIFEAKKDFPQAEVSYKSAVKVLQLIAATPHENLDADGQVIIPLYKQSTATCDRLLAPVCPTAKEMQAGADRCLALQARH
jgi:tetratricopeptide (TPR) repeat protein